MRKLLQINVCLNLSTGRIAQQVGDMAISNGWESWIAYSGREKYIYSKSKLIKVGTFADACIHYAGQLLFDNEGLLSSFYTKKLITKIDEIQPDIIHLHNIHDHWLNYPILLEYIAKRNIPMIWTLHDCWNFTGGCMYFDMLQCERWRKGCNNCPDKRTILMNQSSRNFKLKQELLSKINNLVFVPVSKWLADLLRASVHNDRSVRVIHNGIDLKTFKPTRQITDSNPVKSTHKQFKILGVAAIWDNRKGLNDFLKLRAMLSSDYEITLVGLTVKQIKSLPKGIKGICRTSNVEELAQLYSDSDVFINPTYSDNFPTTNIESLACGTPVITYRTGGSPEAIDEKTGVVIEQGDLISLANSIMWLREHPLSSYDCRKRAEELFDKEHCYNKYLSLYEELLQNRS